jgi:hypothetical protein
LAAPAVTQANHSPGLLERDSRGQYDNGPFGAEFKGASQDGSRVFFSTSENLFYFDFDERGDIYERSGSTFPWSTWVSAGEVNGNGFYFAIYDGASADGARVFFSTGEQLDSADTDGGVSDIYERSGGHTTLVSAGEINGNGNFHAGFRGTSADGTRVIFETAEQLVPADQDGAIDIYQRAGGTTTLVSAGQVNGNGAFDPITEAVAGDATRVVFSTEERLTSDDHDNSFDLYAREGATTTRVSEGEVHGSGPHDAFFFATSQDGTRVFFDTDERLTSEDDDNAFDTYERSGGTTTLVTKGQTNGSAETISVGLSPDGAHFFFLTDESFDAGDTDGTADLYERAGGTTALVSTGPLGGNTGALPNYAGVSPDGARVFFATGEQMVSGDTDSAVDIYERAGGTTSLVSTGPAGGNGAFTASYAGVSNDGTRVFFHTNESLVAEDTDSAQDIYERLRGTTTLVSLGPVGGNGPYAADLQGLSPDGKRAYFVTQEQLVSDDTDNAHDVYTAREGGYPRPKAATPSYLPLVVAFEDCGAPNRVHPSPLAFGSCAPPAQTSSLLTVGTPDANARQNAFSGFVRLRAVVGDPGTAGDQADISLDVSASDVRRSADLSDYAGELELRQTFRLTDQDNGPDTGTVLDFPLSFAVPCSVTADTAVGGTCALSTSVDAVVPGTVKESGRMVLEDVAGARVFDGGTDGSAVTTADNTLFLRQGVFVP